MAEGDVIRVSVAGVDRRDALAPVFGRAFIDDPMMRWTMGDPPRQPDRFTPCFAAFLELALPHGVVWEAGPGRGAAVWVPPGRLEDWSDHPWNQPDILALTDDGGRRYDSFWRWVDERAPDEPAWLLDSLAVHPDFQGQRYGSTLIRAGLELARADGVGAYLSTGTERNVAIYGHFGFRVAEAVDAPDGGPRIWFMRWDP